MKKNIIKKRISYICVGGLLFVVCMSGMMRWFILFASHDHIIATADIAQVESCQHVIILGARVYDDGRMSGILQERALAALDVYNEGKVCSILISGDSYKKNGGIYDEVKPVYDLLIASGVDPAIIVTDRDGYDTFASMCNARDIFGVGQVLIVTQDFHLARAVYLARACGLDATGYVAYKYPYHNKMEKVRNYMREFPAAVKAICEVCLKR